MTLPSQFGLQGFLVLTAGLGGPLGLLLSTRLVPYVGTVAAATRHLVVGRFLGAFWRVTSAAKKCAARLLAYGQLICAAIVCIWLPETKGRELEEINSWVLQKEAACLLASKIGFQCFLQIFVGRERQVGCQAFWLKCKNHFLIWGMVQPTATTASHAWRTSVAPMCSIASPSGRNAKLSGLGRRDALGPGKFWRPGCMIPISLIMGKCSCVFSSNILQGLDIKSWNKTCETQPTRAGFCHLTFGINRINSKWKEAHVFT